MSITTFQAITVEHNVSIKFPDRESQPKTQPSEEGEESTEAPPPPTTDPSRNVILVTGRKENCEAAKQALLVSDGGEGEREGGGERW